tara:strand:- start:7 stop:453 length:447 start_codon:yes stop_codon:yes gene_type:complete
MINEDTLHGEVRKFVSDLVDSGVETPVEWITTHFLNSSGAISGEGVALYRYCTRAHVNRIVKRVVGKYNVEAHSADDCQLPLDGFDLLQRAYTVPRDGKIVMVPIDKCTSPELLDRADEYDKQAKSCRLHARELRSYVKARNMSAQAA